MVCVWGDLSTVTGAGVRASGKIGREEEEEGVRPEKERSCTPVASESVTPSRRGGVSVGT